MEKCEQPQFKTMPNTNNALPHFSLFGLKNLDLIVRKLTNLSLYLDMVFLAHQYVKMAKRSVDNIGICSILKENIIYSVVH